MIDFDPNNSAPADSGLFALPYGVDEASVVVVPVPWDATSSQVLASSGAPDAVSAASRYVELFDPIQGAIYRRGIAMDAVLDGVAELNERAITLQESPSFRGDELTGPCERLNGIVEDRVAAHLAAGKRVGVLGGDHSVAYGAIRAHVGRFPNLGILQIDAHCDLRRSFDDIRYSHASVMFHVVEDCRPAKLVQVGVRGLCDFEAEYLRRSSRVHTFFDAHLHASRAAGESWDTICSGIVDSLPAEVYVTLDIDGLAPSACPNTGTPVPGGLDYNDVVFLLRRVRDSGRAIVGFDLVEVGANEFDANIAAHLLYQLCGLVA